MNSRYVLSVLGTLCLSMPHKVESLGASDAFAQNMCQYLCRRLFGCSASEYMASALSCDFIFILENDTPLRKGRYSFHECQGTPKVKVNQEMEEIREANIRQIFVFSCLWTGPAINTWLYQFFIANNSLTKYGLRVGMLTVAAVAYIHPARRLLVATGDPYKLFLTTFEGGEYTVMEGVQVRGIAVDSRRQLVFLSVSSPWKRIIRMTTTGKNVTPIATLDFSPYGIAINPEQELIYVASDNKGFAKVSYYGAVLAKKDSLMIKSLLQFDTERRNLYYIQNNPTSLFRLSLEDYTSTSLIDFRVKVISFCATKDAFYVVQAPPARKMFVFTRDGRKTEIDLEFKVQHVLLCAVP